MDQPKGIKQRLSENFFAQSADIALRLAAQVVLVPLFLTAWGTEFYAVWLQAMGWAGLFSIFDFGVSLYFGNRMRAAWAVQDYAQFERMAKVALGLVCVGLVLGVLLLVCGYGLFSGGYLPAAGRESNDGIFLSLIVALALMNLAGLGIGFMTMVYRGSDRFSRGLNIRNVMAALHIVAVPSALMVGAPPGAVAGLYAVLALVTIALMGIDLHLQKLRPTWPPTPGRPSRSELSEAFPKMIWYTGLIGGNIVLVHIPILLLGYLSANAGALVTFSVMRTLVNIIRQVVYQFSVSSSNEMSRLLALADIDGVRRLLLASFRLFGGLAGVAVGFLAVYGESIIQVWTLGKVTYDPSAFAVLCVGIFLLVPGYIFQNLLFFSNQPRAVGIAIAASGSIFIGLGIVLIPSLAALGAAIALVVGEAAGLTVGLFWAAAAVVGNKTIWRGIGLAAGQSALTFVISVTIAFIILHIKSPEGIADLFLGLVMWGGGAALVVYLVVLTKGQRLWIKRIILT